MATANAAKKNDQKKMQYKPVVYDVEDIAPDAPAGEWQMSIPRGKCKIQPTREDHFPMVVVPIRLDKTEEDEEIFEKALGTELTVFLVFGGKSPRAERLSKLRVRQACELLDIDLDIIPKKLTENAEDELQPFVRALEGKKFTGWTILRDRSDTGETVTEVSFVNPSRALVATDSEEDDEDEGDADDEDDTKPAARGARKKTTKNGKARR
jgi:hypothetical protein